MSEKTNLGRDYLVSPEKTKTREYNNKKVLKRFVSLLMVACMAVSMVAGAEGRPKEEAEKGSVQASSGDSYNYFENENFRYSISTFEDGRVLFCAVDKTDESKVYQQYLDMAQYAESVGENANDAVAITANDFDSIAEFGFANLETSDVFSMQTVTEPATRTAADEVKLLNDLQIRYGNDYTNQLKYGSDYNNNYFKVLETQISGVSTIDTKLFSAGITIAAMLTGLGLGQAFVALLSGLFDVAGGLDGVIGFVATVTRYGCSTVRTRDTYLSTVSYLINATWVEYGYIGLGVKNGSKPAQLAYDATSYQHSESYFNDFAQQVRDAYRNYFG